MGNKTHAHRPPTTSSIIDHRSSIIDASHQPYILGHTQDSNKSKTVFVITHIQIIYWCSDITSASICAVYQYYATNTSTTIYYNATHLFQQGVEDSWLSEPSRPFYPGGRRVAS